jgi:hypothetical protein
MQDGEINLKEIIQKLWKKKFLIFFVSLIFAVTGYVYGVLQPKIYKSEIILREAPNDLFNLNNFFFNTRDKDVITDLNEQIKLNLLSRDNLIKFYESNNKITDLKNYLKEKNISTTSYFDENSKYIVFEKKNNENRYTLTFTEHLLGKNFLEDYIVFTQKEILTIFKKRLIQKIIDYDTIIKINFEIAKNINLVDPIPLYENKKSSVDVYETSKLFYSGTKLLSQQSKYLNILINQIESSKIEYDPILQKSSKELLIFNPPKLFASMGFLLGLFFLFIIYFVKNFFK